jgi:hypothetical protein
MTKSQLITVYNSTFPIDCYIIQGRLETEGVDSFVFDAEIISINPFKSVAVGGVKLKVASAQIDKAKEILNKMERKCLFDEMGDYDLNEALIKAFEKQDMVLIFNQLALSNPSILDDKYKQSELLKPELFSDNEIVEIIEQVREYRTYDNLKLSFSWKQFFYELFDFDRELFKYLRVKPSRFYIDKDILVKFEKNGDTATTNHSEICPNCKSNNVRYGYAIDYKYDILYLILSFLMFSPFFPIRKKKHCFDCGHDFR